jgi:uncharacterized protein YozE (UPF0346 family)
MMKFNDWLMNQSGRDDAIGRFATLLQHDSTSPLWSSDLSVYNQYLAARVATAEMIESFAVAVAEWKMATN